MLRQEIELAAATKTEAAKTEAAKVESAKAEAAKATPKANKGKGTWKHPGPPSKATPTPTPKGPKISKTPKTPKEHSIRASNAQKVPSVPDNGSKAPVSAAAAAGNSPTEMSLEDEILRLFDPEGWAADKEKEKKEMEEAAAKRPKPPNKAPKTPKTTQKASQPSRTSTRTKTSTKNTESVLRAASNGSSGTGPQPCGAARRFSVDCAGRVMTIEERRQRLLLKPVHERTASECDFLKETELDYLFDDDADDAEE